MESSLAYYQADAWRLPGGGDVSTADHPALGSVESTGCLSLLLVWVAGECISNVCDHLQTYVSLSLAEVLRDLLHAVVDVCIIS